MTRYLVLPIFFLTGCSTAPIAGLLDNVAPSRIEKTPSELKLPDPGRLPPPDVIPRTGGGTPNGLADPVPPEELPAPGKPGF